MVAPPANFEGPLDVYLDKYVVPNFPSADQLSSWGEALLSYFSGTDPVCIVRGRQRGELPSAAEC
jgi:hypothetical protein